jgi:hypothetical protein
MTDKEKGQAFWRFAQKQHLFHVVLQQKKKKWAHLSTRIFILA